jgi:hypothetical protein
MASASDGWSPIIKTFDEWRERKAREGAGRGVRRLCIAVDLEHYSQRPDSGQIEAQRAMSELLRQAGQYGALERAQWDIQPQGDGELALLPPGIDETFVITSLMQQVSSGLHRYNRYASPSARLRMRIAVHEGLTYVAESGFAGDAINTVCRLRDAQESKDALRTAKNDVVLIVSERIFRDVICGGDTYELPAASFRETEIVMADKGFRAQAFTYTGQMAGTAQAAESAAGQAAPEPARPRAQPTPSGGASFVFGDHTSVGDIAGRDIIKNQSGTPAIRPAERGPR